MYLASTHPCEAGTVNIMHHEENEPKIKWLAQGQTWEFCGGAKNIDVLIVAKKSQIKSPRNFSEDSLIILKAQFYMQALSR